MGAELVYDSAFVGHDDNDARIYSVFDSTHVVSVGNRLRVCRFEYPRAGKITEIAGDINMNVGDAIQSLSNSPEKLKLSLCGEDPLVDPPE
jgi:hypothetical protein